MASGHTGSSSAQQPFATPQPAPVPQQPDTHQAVSPPTRQNLKTWWKGFSSRQVKAQEEKGNKPHPASIFSGKHAKKAAPTVPQQPSCDRVSSVKEQEAQVERTDVSMDVSLQSIPDDASTPSGAVLISRSVQPPRHECGPSSHKPYSTSRAKPVMLRRFSSIREGSPNCRVAAKDDNPNKASSFVVKIKNRVRKLTRAEQPTGIFGVPLRQSITYANVAISLVDAEGKSYIYGYVPIVVAKCGVFLKEKATNVEGIFRLSGSEKRIKELRTIFDSPDRYGKGLDWNGYTVHDAANVLRRYLNQLPEPIIPLELYDRFREPLRGHVQQAVGDQQGPQDAGDFDLERTIAIYQQLITELPPLNRQLLLYILDLLAVFASKSDENRMTSANLAAIFQPGMLSHPTHDMAPSEYRLSQDVLVFLIENQDHFLIGMRGTAVDEQTVQDVEKGSTPPPSTPTGGKGILDRSSSNASAGAESLRRQGGVRRNVSVNSRHSRQSNGAPSPASPAFGTSLTQTSSGNGVHRSNTVPSKKSPGLPSRFKSSESRSPVTPFGFSSPRSSEGPVSSSAEVSSGAHNVVGGAVEVSPVATGQSQDRLIPDSEAKEGSAQAQPQRTLFPRSATAESSDKRQPNKLRKKRIPGSSNPSAQSSTNSLHNELESTSPGIPPTQYAEGGEPLHSDEHPHLDTIPSSGPLPASDQPQNVQPSNTFLQAHSHHPSDATLKPRPSSNSLRSRELSDLSDVDHGDDPVVISEQKEKRRLFRLSRRNQDTAQSVSNLTTPPSKKQSATNNGPETSTTSLGSSRPRKSFTAETAPVGTDPSFSTAQQQSSNESGEGSGGKEEKQGPLGWLKNKMREAKEEKRERDAAKERERGAKSASDRAASTSPGREATRGKSVDIHRNEPEKIPEVPDDATQPPAPKDG